MTIRELTAPRAMPSRMRGMSLLGWLLTATLVVVRGTAAIRIIPAFLEYNTVRTVINNALSDSQLALQSEREIREGIRRRFDVNNVNGVSANEIKIVKDGRRVHVSVDYEVREPLLGNVDVVMSFKRDFEKDITR